MNRYVFIDVPHDTKIGECFDLGCTADRATEDNDWNLGCHSAYCPNDLDAFVVVVLAFIEREPDIEDHKVNISSL